MVMATSLSGLISRSRCMLYRAASVVIRDGCPAVRVYWCDPCCIASIDASRTNSGGGQFGKPWPRLIALSFMDAARAPNSLHTVGPVLPPSLAEITLSDASRITAGGSPAPRLPSLPPILPSLPSSLRSFSITIFAPSRRSRFSVSDSSSNSFSSSSRKFSSSSRRQPPSKQTSPPLSLPSPASPEAAGLPDGGQVAVMRTARSDGAQVARGEGTVRSSAE